LRDRSMSAEIELLVRQIRDGLFDSLL